MTGKLMIIWDYDGSVGKINASYPYKFDESKIFREIENVDTILELAIKYDLHMTFACTGFGAEPGLFPYHIPGQIRKIHALGHEIASHSWRHEWFPFLERQQIIKSLERSKFALESCIGVPGAVKGFVLPFSRPMSWYARGALSLGDRVFGVRYPGADLGSVLKFVYQAGYLWSRVSYRPIWGKFFGQKQSNVLMNSNWKKYRGLVCVPGHHFGFDEVACSLVKQLAQEGGKLVIGAHPAALDFGREESLDNLKQFLQLVYNLKRENNLLVQTVSENLEGLA